MPVQRAAVRLLEPSVNAVCVELIKTETKVIIAVFLLYLPLGTVQKGERAIIKIAKPHYTEITQTSIICDILFSPSFKLVLRKYISNFTYVHNWTGK